MRHPGALRNYTSTLKELARRGHQIHLAFMMQDKLGDGRLLWELTNDHPEITYLELGKKTPWRFWLGLARVLRFTTDYVRYLTPEYDDATALKDRAGLRIPRAIRVFFRLPVFRTRAGVAAAAAMLRTVERALPLDRWIRDIVASQNPDVVLITPLVDLGSDQVEYVKAARALGIRSALCVHSWDNLTNKGLIRVLPDRVFVWNEAQKREAVADAPGEAGERRRDRSARLRPVVRATAEHHPRGVLREDRAVAGQAVLPLSLLVAVHRARRGGVRRRLDPGRSIGAGSTRARSRHPDSPAPRKPAALAALRLRRVPRSVTLAARRRQSGRCGLEERLLRLDVPRDRRGRRQHQRADRGRHRRPPRLFRCVSRSTPARRKGRFTSTTC